MLAQLMHITQNPEVQKPGVNIRKIMEGIVKVLLEANNLLSSQVKYLTQTSGFLYLPGAK